jgi:hypothetical protein
MKYSVLIVILTFIILVTSMYSYKQSVKESFRFGRGSFFGRNRGNRGNRENTQQCLDKINDDDYLTLDNKTLMTLDRTPAKYCVGDDSQNGSVCQNADGNCGPGNINIHADTVGLNCTNPGGPFRPLQRCPSGYKSVCDKNSRYYTRCVQAKPTPPPIIVQSVIKSQ